MKRTPHEKRTDCARLRAAGIPLPPEEQSVMNPDLRVVCLKGSRAFTMKMGSEFLLNLRITNDSYADLQIEKLQGRLLAANGWLEFQGDSMEHHRDRKTYRTPGGRYVRHKSVLNHRLRRKIAPGASVEGKLLAFSFTGEIPGEYLHGERVPLELILTDQYGRRFPSIFGATVDRSATMAKPEVVSRVGRGLYDGAPPVPEFDHPTPGHVPAGRADTGESAAKGSNFMETFANAMAYVAKTDLDTIPAESTSAGDEVRVDSRQRQKRWNNVRAGKGSGLYGSDPNAEPPELFEEGARRRLLHLLAHERDADQQRVAGLSMKDS
jgi:hypothetical protein